MRFVFVVVTSCLLLPVAPASAQVKDADRETAIADIKNELADIRARIAAIERQVAQLEGGKSLDLLALLDLKQDTVAGDWKWKGKRLVGPATGDAKVAFPVRPSGDYQFAVKFKRLEGKGGPILCLPVGDRHVNFALDAYDGLYSALEAVDGAFVNNFGNPTMVKGKHVVTDKTHTLEAKVLMKGDLATISVDLDGKRLVEWTGKPSRLSLHPAWRLKDDRQLGLRSWQPLEFEAAQLRMLTGEANPIREAAPAPK